MRESDIKFVGSGVALDYARLNDRWFYEVVEKDTSDEAQMEPEIRNSDCVVSVMNAELVFWSVRAGRRVYFFDSLLSFWGLNRDVGEIARVADEVRSGSEVRARAAFDSLAAHEQVFLCHMLADRSYAQNFPGVEERVAALREHGFEGVSISGPIVNVREIEEAAEVGGAPTADLLINLGGFKNFYLDYDRHNAYLEIMTRWARDLLRRRPRFERIAVCSGAFRTARSFTEGGRQVELRCLEHKEFLRELAGKPVYLATPGLTSLHEAIVSDVMPMALPEQHYGHLFNMKMLEGTQFAQYGASLSGSGIEYPVPEDDFEGTKAIAAAAERIARDEALYLRFRDYMNERLDTVLSVGADKRSVIVEELRSVIHGSPLTEIVGKIENGY